MLSALDRRDLAARSDSQFIVRYNGKNSHIWAPCLFFVAVFGALLALYLDGDTRRLIFNRNTQVFRPFSWVEFAILVGFMLTPLFDLVMTLVRCRPGEVALAMSSEGILCSVVHMPRLIAWNDIATIEEDGKYLTIRRQPRTLLQKLFASRRHGGIHIRLSSIDHDANEVFALVRRVDPNFVG